MIPSCLRRTKSSKKIVAVTISNAAVGIGAWFFTTWCKHVNIITCVLKMLPFIILHCCVWFFPQNWPHGSCLQWSRWSLRLITHLQLRTSLRCGLKTAKNSVQFLGSWNSIHSIPLFSLIQLYLRITTNYETAYFRFK